MPYIVAPRVAETSTTTGTGALALAAAVTGHQRFSAAMAVADTCHYTVVAEDGSWECGIGTYSGTDTLTRTKVEFSSNSNALVNFAAGDKKVFLAFPGTTSVKRSPRTSNTALSTVDRGALVEVTSGTFTQTFGTAANLGDGWNCYYKNSGTGVVVLDPNGAETIDGLTSFEVYPKEMRLITCDGVSFKSEVLHPFVLEPSTTMTFIEPPGYRGYEVFLAAPGGGGGSGRRGTAGSKRQGGAAGGGGATNWASLRADTPGASITLTVGADGAGGAAVTVDNTNGNAGSTGGTHSFGSLLFAFGGNGGAAGTNAVSASSGGLAGSATLGMIVSVGTTGGNADTNPNGTNGANNAAWGSSGGGGGGGLDAANTVRSVGAGGYSGSVVDSRLAGGIAGVAGGVRQGGDGNLSSVLRAGTGGGGGAAHASDAGADGGNGKRGGGGGGGSGSVNGQPSGAGGNGEGYFYVGGLL